MMEAVSERDIFSSIALLVDLKTKEIEKMNSNLNISVKFLTANGKHLTEMS
jgi:hypothetical protein